MAQDLYANMSFSTIFRKASNLLGIGAEEVKSPPLDGEIIYCKNNVCVHPPAPLTLEVEHHPGYLTIRAQQDEVKGPTLVLTWIPNASLKKNPRSIESSPAIKPPKVLTPRSSPRKAPKQEFAKPEGEITPSDIDSPDQTSSYLKNNQSTAAKSYKQSLDNTSLSSDSVSICSHDETPSLESWTAPCDEASTSDKAKLSSSCKSQTDSGIGSDEVTVHSVTHNAFDVQNNVKVSHLVRPSKIGVNVNVLHEKNCNSNHEIKNLINVPNKEEELSALENDGLTSEEQLAAMMQRNKLHAKKNDVANQNQAVKSIVMDGDSLQVVTEEKETFLESKNLDEKNINKNESKFETSSSQSTDVDSMSSDSSNPSPSDTRYENLLAELKQNGIGQNIPQIHHDDDVFDETLKPDMLSEDNLKGSLKVPNELDLESFIIPPPNTPMLTPDISVTRYRNDSSSSTTTSGPDSRPPTPYSSDPESEPGSPTMDDSTRSLSTSSTGSISYSHNLTFPENSVTYSCNRKEKKSAKEQVCGVFSVDLGQMRSLRLFYSDNQCTKGQVVIASRESQYKILHFHSGGLEKLAEIFEDWNLFRKARTRDSDTPYRQFLVMKPQVTGDQCHPEEGVYPRVTEDVWQAHMMDDGIVEDDYQLRKAVFFGGLDPLLRHEAWPFLLKFYPFSSTFEDREKIRNDKYIEYHNIRKQRESMPEKEAEKFWKTIQCTVEKDVVRTDRSHRYFRGEHNPNIEILKNILLNYAVAHPTMGYTQGMSDLLSPVLAEIQHEVYAYWCFEGLMQRTIFVSSPRDSDMDKQLSYLRELLRLMGPTFYQHLKKLGDDALELLFCHRWILLCFKREFSERDALVIWEVCWSHYQTDYFHLFICVAIVCIYGDDVVEQNLPADEILLHFSSLALHMNGQVVLKKARGLLHQYRKRRKIPCTLHGLCTHCDPGMWDSGHVPTVECIGHPEGTLCPYSSTPNSPEDG